MLDINDYRRMFANKLLETGSLDDAFQKIVHHVYQKGIQDAQLAGSTIFSRAPTQTADKNEDPPLPKMQVRGPDADKKWG